MKYAHVSLCAAAIAAASSAVHADDTAKNAALSLPFDPAPAHVIKVTSLRTGREIPQGGPRPRGIVIGYDNLSSPTSSAMLNVAYTVPGSYNGSNPSTQANIFGLGNGPAGSALRAFTSGANPNPTHIVWDDFTGDPAVWPGGEGASANGVEFDIVSVRINPAGSPARMDEMRIFFFSPDGLTLIDGFAVLIDTPANFAAYQRVNIDLSAADPPIQIPQAGHVMVDYVPPAGQTQIIGVGLAFAGGDLLDNVNYPAPASLVTVGSGLHDSWFFSDAIRGDADHPAGPDPDFDLMPGVSYLDLFNTSQLVNWQVTSNNPLPLRTLTHDFPILIMVSGAPTTGACVAFNDCMITNQADCETVFGGTYLGDGTTCGGGPGACCVGTDCQIVLAEAVCTALSGTYRGEGSACGPDSCPATPLCPCNFNGDAFLNSQDFFDFIACFFTQGCPQADYNNDQFINSQDFFDFLACIFVPPPGCM